MFAFRRSPIRLCTRAFSISPIRKFGLENVLEGPIPPALQVKAVTSTGIDLADGLHISSACIFLGGKVFLWRVPTTMWDGWATELFQIFEVVVPKPELLLLGTGKQTLQPPLFIRQYLNSIGVGLEVMDTRNACSTFNLLAEEGRRVAAALVPTRSTPRSD